MKQASIAGRLEDRCRAADCVVHEEKPPPPAS